MTLVPLIQLSYDPGAGVAWVGTPPLSRKSVIFISRSSTPNGPCQDLCLESIITILDALYRIHLSTPLGLAFPKVLYHEAYNDRYYLFTASVSSSTIGDGWLGMDETARQR